MTVQEFVNLMILDEEKHSSFPSVVFSRASLSLSLFGPEGENLPILNRVWDVRSNVQSRVIVEYKVENSGHAWILV